MIQENITLAPFSTFFVGGSADFYIKITKKEDIFLAMAFAHKKKIPFFCLAGGSNLVFSDNGFRGIVLHFANQAKERSAQGFFFESGVRMPEVHAFTKQYNKDFSIFSTIPGTIGGAVAGNAGLPHAEMKDIVLRVELYDLQTNTFVWKEGSFLQFAYRYSCFHEADIKNRYILWKVEIALPHLPKDQIDKKAKEYMKTRKEKQPWGRTGGSFFRNPPEGAAGMFLEKAGLKGFTIGGAFFSEKHANFMMNDGTATQNDIIALAQHAQKLVFEQFGVHLHHEVRLINEFGEFICIE